MSVEPTDGKPLLFISHKHADRAIADTIRSFVTMSSGGRVAVFQSSSPMADAPKVGRNLNKQLREALWRTSVVILIYTVPDQDWTYCMWECGVASLPQSPDTKIILFQCVGSAPPLFADQVNVNAHDLVDIQKFTDDFLTGPDFFPGYKGPITQFQPHGHEVASAAADLSQRLKPLLPDVKEDPSEEWPAAPFVQLELNMAEAERIKVLSPEERSRLAPDIILNGCLVIAADRYGEQLFGVPSFPSGMSLRQLSEIWTERYPDSKSEWVSGLSSQILAGVLWRFPTPGWELMEGPNDGAWYAPIVNRVRRIPKRQCLQFDVYFYKLYVKAGDGAVTIPVPGG